MRLPVCFNVPAAVGLVVYNCTGGSRGKSWGGGGAAPDTGRQKLIIQD